MLVEDTAAFIEQLEVRDADRRARKRRRRLACAELDVMKAEVDARLAADALRRLAADLAVARELEDARGVRLLAREATMVRGRLRAARHELQVSRDRLGRVQRHASDEEETGRRAKVFRLHSARHHLECSERRFARLSASQVERPVLVATRDGRHWWWYLDRFWWDDEGLSARAVAATVRGGMAPQRQDDISAIVRFAVWFRDRGRCVDCRSADDLGYDPIFPFSRAGRRRIANVELRCAECRDRRKLNTARADVSRARIESVGFARE